MEAIVVPCNEIYREGNFIVQRPIVNNSQFKPMAFLLDSIFVDGSFLNYAHEFLNLLMQHYNVFIAGWDNNIDYKTKYFGRNDYVRCLINGIKATKAYCGCEDLPLLITYSSALGMALYASEQESQGIKRIAMIGTSYSFRLPWAENYKNYRLVFEDDLIERSWKQGLIKGSELDSRFEWMDKKYAVLAGRNPHSIATMAESYKHVDIPVRAYSDWMDVVRYNSLESRNLCFEKEDLDCAVILYGYKDYITNSFTSVEPLLTRMNLGSEIMSIGSDLGHRELLGSRAARHQQSMLDFLRD